MIFVSIILVVSCIKEDFDTPPIKIPKVDFTSNTTIAELKSLYNNDLDSITEDIIIQGIIIANDESGNLFIKHFIKDNSGGIEIKLIKQDYIMSSNSDKEYLLNVMACIGQIWKMQQLGYVFNNAIGRSPDVLVSKHLYKDSLPGPIPKPQLISIPEITSANLGTLIRLDDVYFDTPGLPFAEQQTTYKSNIERSLIIQ